MTPEVIAYNLLLIPELREPLCHLVQGANQIFADMSCDMRRHQELRADIYRVNAGNRRRQARRR